MKKEALIGIHARNSNASSKDAVADRATLLAHIEELEKVNRGLRARKIGLLLLAQSVTGVSYEAVRADAKSKLGSKYPELVEDWDL